MGATPHSLLNDERGLQRRIEELGPWFHNMRLGEVQTAPQHFLGDYPEIKFRSFRDALPTDMSGLSVSGYRLQWRILFVGDETPRCRARAWHRYR